MLSGQRSLFGGGAPSTDAAFTTVRHIALDASAWVEHATGWLGGHETVTSGGVVSRSRVDRGFLEVQSGGTASGILVGYESNPTAAVRSRQS